MTLNTAQIATLRAAMLADPNLAAGIAAGDYGVMAAYLAQPSSFIVWRSTTPTRDVLDSVIWASMTPVDAPDGTQAWLNRTMMCQSKQLNLQILLQGTTSVRSDKSNIRSGLQDALTNVPSGASGARVAAGWSAVRLAMQRPATQFEAIFATGTGTQATPGSLVVEGTVDYYDITRALYQ